MIILRIILWIIAISAVVGLVAAVIDIVNNKARGFYARCIKRFLDAFLSTGALIVLSPFLIILTVIGAIKMKGNPFFTQERPGWHEKIFKLIKFRTMSNEKDKDGNLLPDEVRLNSYGRFLRSTSLDELPELFNIMLGQMAIIGPRPLLVRYLPRYTPEQHRRHEVRPGLTGYAQAHGRNAVTWEEKFKMDVWYVDHLTFKTDYGVFIDTIKSVLKREGISGGGEATMSEFMGTEEKGL